MGKLGNWGWGEAIHQQTLFPKPETPESYTPHVSSNGMRRFGLGLAPHRPKTPLRRQLQIEKEKNSVKEAGLGQGPGILQV